MFRHAPQHLHQRAALLAGAHHIHVHVGKNDRMARHGIRKTSALHDILLELLADFRRDALGFQMRHAVQRHGQWHARLQQVGHLLRECGQLLQLGFALTIQERTQCRRQKACGGRRFASGPLCFGGSRVLGCVHRDGKKTEPFDLQQGRRAVRHVEDTLHDFAGLAPRLVGKLGHKTIHS